MFSLISSAKSSNKKDKDKDKDKEEGTNNSNAVKLPPIVNNSSNNSNENNEDNEEDKDEERNDKNKRREKEEKDFLKPHDYDFWVRTLDTQNNNSVYYYNTHSGESAWLAPCSVCFRSGEKWCIDCQCTYCDKHYAKKHRNEKDPNHAALRKHKWAKNETNTEREPLEQEGDTHCVECGVKVATKLCDTCWDAYCTRCFELVHHVGALKLHKGVNYRRAKKQWYCVKQALPEPDYYVNGASGEKTFEKPPELMTELERVLSENFKTHKVAAEEYVKKVEELQFELEKIRYERDNLLLENAQLLQQSRAKPEASAAVAGKQSNDDYRQKLMNPSDRRRGEAKNNKIKEVIDMPLPTPSTK